MDLQEIIDLLNYHLPEKTCDKCGGTNIDDISEHSNMTMLFWCYDCKENCEDIYCVRNAVVGELKNITREICICAAIKTVGGKIIKGHRHGDCLRNMWERPVRLKEDGIDAQGFVTSLNRFVTRKEGRRLQEEAGIESVSPEGYVADTLFSEDLY